MTECDTGTVPAYILSIPQTSDPSTKGLTLSVCGKFEPENVQNASVPPRSRNCCGHCGSARHSHAAAGRLLHPRDVAAGISAFERCSCCTWCCTRPEQPQQSSRHRAPSARRKWVLVLNERRRSARGAAAHRHHPPGAPHAAWATCSAVTGAATPHRPVSALPEEGCPAAD